MSYIKADNPTEQEHFDFLEDLRQSGDTNMYGASPYLESAFDLARKRAVSVLSKWMKLHRDPTRILQGPSSAEKISAEMVTEVVVTRKPRKRKEQR